MIGGGAGGARRLRCGGRIRRAGGADRKAGMGGERLYARRRAGEGAAGGGQARQRHARRRAVRRQDAALSASISPRCEEHVRRVVAAVAPQRCARRGSRPRRAGHRGRGAVQGSRAPLRSATLSRSVRAVLSSPPARRRRCRRSPGSTRAPYLTSETVFDLAELPRASHRHRRRVDRAGTGAGVPPARQPR